MLRLASPCKTGNDLQEDTTTRGSELRWRRGLVVSVIRRMNEVTLRLAWLVLGWVTVGGRVRIPSRYVTSQLGQLSFASVWGR